MKKCFYIISIFCFAVTACTKTGGAATEEDIHQVDPSDDIFPVITITRPTDNQVYVSGDSIIVEGNATDNKSMYKGKVFLTNDVTGYKVAEQYYETHFLQTLNFRVAYKATVTTPTDFTVSTEFEDHGLNISTKTLKIKVNP